MKVEVFRGGPDEDFDLAGGVDDDVGCGGLLVLLFFFLLVCFAGLLRQTALLEDGHDLVDLGAEKIEGGEDGAVGAEIVLLHDLLVVDRVADVDVGVEWHAAHGGVEVDHVGRGGGLG
jgi:hypothetical protein